MRILVLLAVAVAACGREAATLAPSPPVLKSAGPVVTKVDDPATVRGVVRWKGAHPSNVRLWPVSNVPDSFRDTWGGDSPPDERVAIAEDGGLPHTLVWAAEGPHRSMKWPRPTEPFELRIRAAMYVPRMFGVRIGQQIRVSTEDLETYGPHVTRYAPPSEPGVIDQFGEDAARPEGYERAEDGILYDTGE